MKTIAVLLSCFLLFVVPAQAQEQLQTQSDTNILDIQNVTSPNGIQAWLVEDHNIPVIALNFSFKGLGAALDPENKQGLAQLASNTMDEGAGDLDSEAFQQSLNDLSIELYFNSTRDSFGGTLKTLTQNKTQAFNLLELALNTPRFDSDPVERMRDSNKSRIRSALSNPKWMSARLINDKAYSQHPYAQNSGGTLSTLDNITIEDLKGFTQQFSQERLVIGVAGDIKPAELGIVLDQIFGDLPATTPVPSTPELTLQNTGKSFVYTQDIPQTIIEILQSGIDRKHPDFHTAQIMNFVLGSSGFGSRLTKKIREEKGLTYGIYTGLSDYQHIDTLSLSTSTKNETAGKMIALIKNEWKKMRTQHISDKELSDAKSYLIGSLPLSLTSTDAIARLLLSLQFSELPIDYLNQREKSISRATKEDVLNVSKRLLNEKEFISVFVGNPVGLENLETVQELPNVR